MASGELRQQLGHSIYRKIFAPKVRANGAIGGGTSGADLLLLISGFLLTWLAVEDFKAKDSIHFRNLYKQRILCLIPALAFHPIVATLCALNCQRPISRVSARHSHNTIIQLIAILVFHRNYTWAENRSFIVSTTDLRRDAQVPGSSCAAL